MEADSALRVEGSGWISVKDRLPEEGKLVLIKVKSPCVAFGYVTAYLSRGITLEERQSLFGNRRAGYWFDSDQSETNKMPYCWQINTDYIASQDVDFWQEIERL